MHIYTPEEVKQKLQESNILIQYTDNVQDVYCTPSKSLVIKLQSDYILKFENGSNFFDAIFNEGDEDPYLMNILKIAKVFGIVLFGVDKTGYSMMFGDIDIRFERFKKKPLMPSPTSNTFFWNSCNEIPISGIHECILGKKATYYSYEEAYNTLIFPYFKKVIKIKIDTDIESLKDFTEQHVHLIKMVYI